MGFVSSLKSENGQGFWFQMSDQQRQKAGSPWGPANPQALNRYSYVLNGPVRWTDPSGHCIWDACIVEAAVGAVIIGGAAYIAIDSATRYAREHPINWGNYYRSDTSTEEEYDEDSSIDRPLQTGGNTIKNNTANALNKAHDLDLSRREWGRALEALKKDTGLGNNHHGKIMESGDYVDADTGEYLGNLLDYLP